MPGRGGQGGRGAQPDRDAPHRLSSTADKIDELFAPVMRAESRATVYTWAPTKTPPELKAVNIRLGVTDGTFSELLSGDAASRSAGRHGVMLPLAQRPNQPGQSIFGQPQRGNPGGMQPGFGPGGPGGGGGNPVVVAAVAAVVAGAAVGGRGGGN